MSVSFLHFISNKQSYSMRYACAGGRFLTDIQSKQISFCDQFVIKYSSSFGHFLSRLHNRIFTFSIYSRLNPRIYFSEDKCVSANWYTLEAQPEKYDFV